MPDSLTTTRPSRSDEWRRVSCLGDPSLLVMSLQGEVALQEVQSTSTSGSGPSGGAPRSTPVTSLTWRRNQMENSSLEVR